MFLVMLSCIFQRHSIQQSHDFQDGSTDSQPKQLGDLLTTDDARLRALGRCWKMSGLKICCSKILWLLKLAHYWEFIGGIPNSQTYNGNSEDDMKL